MKVIQKILSMVLSTAILILSTTFAFAAETSKLQKSQVKEMYIKKVLNGHATDDGIYEELYTHYNQNKVLDWALIYAVIDNNLTDVMIDLQLGTAHIKKSAGDYPFEVGYAVYDAETNAFYDIADAWYSNKYTGLKDIFQSEFHKRDSKIIKTPVYKNEFIKWSATQYGNDVLDEGYQYNELYYHEKNGEIDWALVEAEYCSAKTDGETWLQIGNRNILNQHHSQPFKYRYGLYNVNENQFKPLDELSRNDGTYADVMTALELLNIGKKTGDSNLDGVISASDITMIQRYIAEFSEFDCYQNKVSDINKNGIIDINDATLLQKYLAEIIDEF